MDDVARLDLLRRVAASHDDRQRGKILQRLLALAFDREGYRLVEERLSEGTDLDFCHRERQDEKYSFEVRTTEGFVVPVKDEDLRQMDERARDGYATGIAALRIAPGGRWVFLRREWLMPPSVRLARGTTRGWEELASRINAAFDGVLDSHGEAAVTQGLDGLAAAIREASKG